MLKCMLCNRELRQINGSHLKTHNISPEEYKAKFPGSVLIPHFVEMNKSEEFRKFISENSKGKPKSEEHRQSLKDAKAREDKKHRAKVNGDNRRGKHHNKETLEKISKYSSEQKHPFGGKSGIRLDLGHNCRSTWEANFARILNLLGVEYKYEKIVWLKREDGSDIIYLPDFYLPKYDSYVEIKGRWYNDAKEKFELFNQQYPDKKMHLIELKQYTRYAKHFKNKIKNWES